MSYIELPDESPIGQIDLIQIVLHVTKHSGMNCVAGAEWDMVETQLIILKTQVYMEVPEDDEPQLISQMMGICLSISAIINTTFQDVFLSPISQIEVFPHPPKQLEKPNVLEVCMQFAVHFQN